jgi:cytochrome c oxidase subunit 4
MKQKNTETHIVSYRVNFFIWVSLVLLTGLTIYVAEVNLGKFGILVNILIASIKAGFVVYIFMHLKYESWFLKMMLSLVVLTLTVIIVLTFLDILYR